jgi:hypothetical protein
MTTVDDYHVLGSSKAYKDYGDRGYERRHSYDSRTTLGGVAIMVQRMLLSLEAY